MPFTLRDIVTFDCNEWKSRWIDGRDVIILRLLQEAVSHAGQRCFIILSHAPSLAAAIP